MELMGGFEPPTSSLPNRNLKLFKYFTFVYGRFHSISFAFQNFLSLLFPHIPRRSVAVCVVKSLAAEETQRLPASDTASNMGKLYTLAATPVKKLHRC